MLAQDVAEVGLEQEFVDVRRVKAHKLVLDALQDGSQVSKRENVEALLLLDQLVLLIEVVHSLERHRFTLRRPELAKDVVAGGHDEVKVSFTALLAEDEDLTLLGAEPVKEGQNLLHEFDVLNLLLGAGHVFR